MVEGLLYLSLFSFWLDFCAGFEYQKLLSLTKGLSLQNMFFYLLIIVWGFKFVKRETIFKQNNVNRYIFILIIFVIISIIPNLIIGYGGYKASLMEEIIGFKQLINPWLYFFLITSLVNEKRACERLINALILFLAITVFTILIQNYLGIDLGTQQDGISYIARSAAFSGPNEYAAFIDLFLPLFMSYMLFQEEKTKRIKGILLFFIGLIGLASTISKGGFIAFIFSIGCFFFYAYRKKMINKMKIFLWLYLLFAISTASFLLLPSKAKEIAKKRFTLQEIGPYDPFAKEFGFLHKLTTGRTEVWLLSLRLIAQKPILGYGNSIASIYVPRSTHNEYLGWLVNYGIIGFLLFSIIYIKIFNHFKYHLKTSTNPKNIILYLGYIGGFIGYVTAMFGACLAQPRIIFWIYTALIYKYTELDAVLDNQGYLDINNSNPSIHYTQDVPNTIMSR